MEILHPSPGTLQGNRASASLANFEAGNSSIIMELLFVNHFLVMFQV